MSNQKYQVIVSVTNDPENYFSSIVDEKTLKEITDGVKKNAPTITIECESLNKTYLIRTAEIVAIEFKPISDEEAFPEIYDDDIPF